MRDTTKKSRKGIISAVVALTAMGIATALFGSTASRDLTWNASGIAPTVVAGGATFTTTVSFTDTGKLPLPDAEVQLSSDLAGLVSVSPAHLGTVKKGEKVTLTLTASAPASSTPAVVSGSIKIQKDNPHHEAYGAPLAVSVHVTWPAVTAGLIQLQYPPSIAAGATVGTPRTTQESDGSISYEIPLSIQNGTQVNTFLVNVAPNPSHLSPDDWFAENVDENGILKSAGVFSKFAYPDGRQALISTGASLPASYDSPLDAFAFVFSPGGSNVATLTLSEDQRLDLLGYTTPTARASLLQSIAANLVLND